MAKETEVLIVVGDVQDRDTLNRILETSYKISVSDNSRQVLELAYKDTLDVVILDLSFNDIQPIETLKAIKHHDPYIEIVIISGENNADTTLKDFLCGVTGYIPKPFRLSNIISVTMAAAEKRNLNLQLKDIFCELMQVNSEIADEAAADPAQEKQLLLKLARIISEHFMQEPHLQTKKYKDYLEFAKVLSLTLESKDPYTYGHSERVSFYSLLIAESLKLMAAEKEEIQLAAYLHDIGKLGINSSTILKKKRLNSRDWEIIKQHPEKGVDLIKPLNNIENIKAYILHHHERFAGNGYPYGLAGESIPLGGRIIAIADSYDAITSDRPYRNKTMTHVEAQQELKRCAGTQFDPLLVEVFLKTLKKNDGLNHSEIAGVTKKTN